MSLSKLSKLPPEVLSSVLTNQAIPLSRRLSLRLISNRWADIIEDGLKKESSLVIRDEKAFYRKPNDLIIKTTAQNDEFIRPLARLFTALTQLSIFFKETASWNALPSLLAHLDTTNLTTVKLYCITINNYIVHMEPMHIIAIANALTALSGLASLTLNGFQYSNSFLPHLGTVLSRLEAFGCLDATTKSAGIISSSLSPRCTHLRLFSDVFQSFPSLFLVELSSNLMHLHLLGCDKTTLQSIAQMHALSKLTLDFPGSVLDSSIFSHLGPFSRLTQVKLLGLEYGAPLALPSKNEKPLSGIKRLTLEVYFYGNSPVDYQAIFSAISAWFPDLVHLTIETNKASIAAIRASQPGQLPFSVEIVDSNSANTWSAADW